MLYQPSKKEILQEILKCGKDPVYFINNYAKISHPIEGLIPFNMYDYQEDLVQDFGDHRFTVILKARQLGISTITGAYMVWMMLFHRDKNILVMATKFGTAANLVKKVKAIMRYLPEWLKIAKISIDNRASFELDNGSQIKASTTSADAGRSEALSLLVIDEAAHVEGLDELWTGLYPTLSTGGRCIALSTPNGVGNWFHRIYVGSEQGENPFSPIKLMWDIHPDRDQQWFEKETKNMSRRQIAQELECNFNTSGETVLYAEDIDRMRTNDVCDPKHKTGFDRNFWIWEEYSPESTYLLTADVARGDGKDFSVYHIIKLENMEVVAEYQGKPDLDIFSNIIFSAGKEYGNCMIVVENNNIGYAILEKLIELQYPNIYHSVKSTHEYIDPLAAQTKSNALPGFTTSMKTRPLIIAKLEEFVRNKLITVHSSRLLHEMTTFIWNNGRPEAMKGYNDDLVISLAIACWVRDTALVTSKRELEYKRAFLDAMIFTNTKIDTKLPGMKGYKKEYNNDKIKEEHDKYSWLLKG